MIEMVTTLCKFCKKSGSKDPLYIKSQDPFGKKAWIKHKRSKTHLNLVGKEFVSVASFFEKVVNTAKPAENDGWRSTVPVSNCTGIYDTRNGKEKYLSAMISYGVYNDLNVVVQKLDGLYTAVMKECVRVASVHKTGAYYKKHYS